MGVWERVAGLLLRLVDRYDEPGIALLVFVEEAGVPSPLPSDLVAVLAGYRAARGEMRLGWVLVALELATVLGASVLYALAARGGRPLLERYGRFVHLGPARLARAEERLRARAFRAILVGRLVPGLRVATVVAAGALGVPYRLFLPGVALGGLAYNALFVALGFYAGPRALAALEEVRLSARAAATLVLLVALAAALALLYRRAARQEPRLADPRHGSRAPETAALAGLLAAIAAGLAVNILLYASAVLGLLPPEAALVRLVERAAAAAGSAGRAGAGLVLLALGAGGAWGIVYGRLGVYLLPGPPWAQGLLFAALPTAASALALLPLLGGGPLGLGLGAGLWPLAGEAARNALFGLGLGVLYPLLQEARAPAAEPDAP